MDFKQKNRQKHFWLNLLKKWLPLLLIFIIFILIISSDLQTYLNFKTLQNHRNSLLVWINKHFLLSLLAFVTIYTLAVSISLPGATILTLTGGFLFGPFLGSILVVFSATMGATIIFFAVKTSFKECLSQKASGWINRVRKGFQKNAFYYLLFLRLVPIFPFWVINIVPALLDIKATTFIVSTFFGILPGSIVYVMVGNGLSHVFVIDEPTTLNIIFNPKVLYPLLALAAISLLPVFYKKIIKK